MIKTTSTTALYGLLLAIPQLGSAALKSECPTVGTPIIVASDGNVSATYVGSTATRYTNRLYLDEVRSGNQITKPNTLLFDNKASALGEKKDLGFFKAGSELVFRLESTVPPKGFVLTYYSGTVSTDGYPHVRVKQAGVGENRVDFEDLYRLPECQQSSPDTPFTDLSFTFSNVEAPADQTGTPTDGTAAAPDSFLSYQSKTSKVPKKTFNWTDAIGNSGGSRIVRTDSLANPASVARQSINSPDVSLAGYQLIKARKKAVALTVSNSLGNWALNTSKPEWFLTPTGVDGSRSPDALTLTDQGIVDDFVCYSAKVTGGAKKLRGVTALLKDRLNEPGRTYKVTKPTRLCVPADSQGDGIQHPETYLMCYGVKPVGVKPLKAKGLNLNSQLVGAHKVNLMKESEYCVPSTVSAP